MEKNICLLPSQIFDILPIEIISHNKKHYCETKLKPLPFSTLESGTYIECV